MKRSKPIKVWEDPVVAEIRRRREAMCREAGGTVRGLVELIERRAAERAAKAPEKPAAKRPAKSSPRGRSRTRRAA